VLLLKILILDRIPAPAPVLAQLAPLADNLLASNFAAYLFFVFSVQIPAVRDKRHLGPLLDGKLAAIAHGTTGFLTMVAHAQQRQLPQTVTRAAVDELFAGTDARATSLMRGPLPTLRSLNWLEAMARFLELSRPPIESTLRHSRYLDSELLRLLSDIEDSPLASSLNETLSLISAGALLTNTSLSAWASNFWARHELDQRLSEYRARLGRDLAIG